MTSLESGESGYFLIALKQIPVYVVTVCSPNLSITGIQDQKQGFLSLIFTASVDKRMQPEIAPGVLESLEWRAM